MTKTVSAWNKEAAEYKSRLFGGAYSNSRLRGLPKDAPLRKIILRARDRYNRMLEDAGLPAISDWNVADE